MLLLSAIVAQLCVAVSLASTIPPQRNDTEVDSSHMITPQDWKKTPWNDTASNGTEWYNYDYNYEGPGGDFDELIDEDYKFNTMPSPVDFWITDGMTDKQYLVLNTYFLEHDLNQDICRDHGGFLPEPRNEMDSDFLKMLFVKYFNLGMTDAQKEGSWVWDSDGSQVTWINWSLNEPNNVNIENCVIQNPDGTWNDVSCFSPPEFDPSEITLICQRNTDPQATDWPIDWLMTTPPRRGPVGGGNTDWPMWTSPQQPYPIGGGNTDWPMWTSPQQPYPIGGRNTEWPMWTTPQQPYPIGGRNTEWPMWTTPPKRDYYLN